MTGKRIIGCALSVFAMLSVQAQQTVCLSIDQLFRQVEDNSKQLRTQKTGVEIAGRGIEVARSKRLPDINATVTASYIGNAVITDRDFGHAQGFHSPHFGNSFSLEAQQVVYAGGAIDAGVRLAELGKLQADAGVRLTRQQARFVALGQYLDLYKADNRVRVYEQNIRLTQQLILDIKEKQQQGMALRNDITRYELQMESLKLGLATVQHTRSILNHQLCNTLGLDPATTIKPDTTVAAQQLATEGEQYWQDVSRKESPLLEQSALRVRMAQERERIAKSDLLPKVALVAANSLNGPITFELPPVDKNLNVWYLGVGVSYPISSLFKSNKRVRQATIETRQMQENQAVQTEQVDNQVQQAYTLYEQAYVEWETQQKRVELARQNYGVMNARYLSQLALVTDMVDASNLCLDAELQEVDARIGIVYAYYRVKYMAGKL